MKTELMNVKQVAAALGVCQRQIWKMASTGQAPKPVRIGRLARWRAGELRQWIDGGCRPVGEGVRK